MARFNEALKDLLTNNRLNDNEEAIAALDAILTAGYDTPEAHKKFKEAVLSQNAFWNKYLNPQIPIDAKSDDELFLCTLGVKADNSDGEPSNDFTALTTLALAKRAELTLKSAEEPQLMAIINQLTVDDNDKKAFRGLLINDDGSNKFGAPKLIVANWNQVKSSAFQPAEVAQFAALKTEAKRQLLIKKINACADKAMINNLLAAEHDQAAFTNAVRALFEVQGNDAHAIADGMRWNPVINDAVKHAAAKKGVSLHVQRLNDSEVLTSFPLLIATTIQDFRDAVIAAGPAIAAAVTGDEAYVNSVKERVGARFLPLKIAKLKEVDPKKMEDVAATGDVGIAKNALRQIPDLLGGSDGAFLDVVVTETSLPQIREACALNALKIRISQCDDSATLEALLKVTTLATLKQVLTEKESLGYVARPKFHDAFKENKAALNSIVAAAHIRKNVALSKAPVLLKMLINAKNDNEFRARYEEHCTNSVMPEVKTAINKHFESPENVKAARAQALLVYAKAALSNLPDNNLKDLLQARNVAEVRTGITALMGGKGANNLLADGVPEDGVLGVELQDYAAIEQVIRRSKVSKDLSQGAAYKDLLVNINNFTFLDDANADVRNIITAPGFPEKHRLQTHLAQSLIRNFPENRLVAPDTNKLVELAKVKDFDEFRRLLSTKFEITDLTWVTKESMDQIQKSACLRQVDLSYSLKLGNETHPLLFKLIENLPEEKRLALLDKPEVIRDLAAASDQVEVERILGGARVVSKALIDGLIKENNRVNLFAKIWNSEIAATLAQITPPITITEKQVEEINKLLVNANDPDKLFNNIQRTNQAKTRTRYEGTIQRIAAIITPNPAPELYAAFGLDANGKVVGGLNPAVAIAQKINSIKAQQDNNKFLIDYHYYNQVSKTVANLLAFKKNAKFTEDDFDDFIEVFNASQSWEDFDTKANEKNFPEVFDPTLTDQLTPQIFEEMKIEVRKKAMEGKKGELTSKEQKKEDELLKKELKIQKEEIKHLDEKFSRVRLDSDTQESLRRLSRASLMYSFNPAFRASAKKNAEQMEPVIRELSEQCKSYITYYANLRHEAEINAETIDKVYQDAKRTNSPKVKLLRNTRDKWVNIHKAIKEELALLRRLQTIYAGNPADANPVIREGLLKSLEDAKTGARDIHILVPGLTTYSVDYDNAERATHFDRGHVGAANPNPRREQGTSIEANTHNEEAPEDALFEIVDAIPSGKFREHTLVVRGEGPNAQDEQALYLEERTSKDLDPEINPANEMNIQPSLKLTANKIPASKEGKVALAMTMAMKAVAALKEPPTEKNPLKVTGDNPEFAKYLWTALMIIGESDPNFKFGKDAIKVTAARVDVDNEKGFLGWSDDSIYNKAFKNSLICKDMLEPIKAINEKRFGVDEELEFEDIVEDTTKLNTFFKPKLTPEVKEELKEVEANRPTLGSSSNSTD